MSDSDDTSIMSKLAGTFGFLVGASLILSFFVATFAINYIEDEMEECETLQGQGAQIIGADEGKCDKGKWAMDLLIIVRYPLLLDGIVVCLIAANVF